MTLLLLLMLIIVAGVRCQTSVGSLQLLTQINWVSLPNKNSAIQGAASFNSTGLTSRVYHRHEIPI